MADFCNQCARDHALPEGDMAELMPGTPLAPGEGITALCEGCGPTLVNKQGDCVYHHCLKEHGKEAVS